MITLYILLRQIIMKNRCKEKLEQYDVQKIIDERKDGKQTLYLVKWVGYSHQDNTWQPYSHLKNDPEKLREWKKRKNEINYSFNSNQGCQQFQDLKEDQKNKSINSSKPNKIIKKPTNISNKNYSKKTMINYEKNLKNRKKVWQKAEYQRSGSNSIQIQKDDKKQRIIYKKVQNDKEMMIQLKIPIYEILEKEPVNQLKLSQKYSTQHSNYQESRQFSDQIINKKQQKEEIKSLQNRIILMNIHSKVERGQENEQKYQMQNKIQCEDQEEIIIEQSVSDSYQQMNNFFNQDKQSENRAFENQININTIINFDNQKQIPFDIHYQQNQSKQLRKSSTSNLNQMIEVQYQQEMLNENESISEIPIIQNILNQNHTSFFQEPVLTLKKRIMPEFAFIIQIEKIYRQNKIVYCSVLMRDQTKMQKIPYQLIEKQRPDVVLRFFNQRYPCKNE